jgi:hypothetical protein
MRRTALLSTVLLTSVLLRAQGDYATLVADFERAAKTDRAAAIEQFVPKFAAAAAAQRGKEDAVPSLAWLVRNGGLGKPVIEALETLAAEHGKSLQLGPVLEVLPHVATYLDTPACATLLDGVLAAGSPPELEARALLARATLVLMRTDADDTQLAAAIADLDKARKLTKDTALAAAMPPVTAEPRGLKIGDRMPEIAGFDLDGAPFRLSDYRGKVVVLDFWGDW